MKILKITAICSIETFVSTYKSATRKTNINIRCTFFVKWT
jgi:hypothetical protein